MAVLSDRSIAQRCTPPTHVFLPPNGTPKLLFTTVHDKDHCLLLDNYEHCIPATEGDWIEELGWEPMISPYHATKVRRDENDRPIASYGQSSAGYDIRCAPEFKLFCGVEGEPIDYKNIREDQFETYIGPKIILPPNSFVLSRSIEKICMPRDVVALCIGKSTPARAAISCLCTPLEPDWKGYVTLEFANTSNQPVILYAHEGAVQLMFLQMDQECHVGYNDNGTGKYNNQAAQITLPRV